jgi:zinc transporter
MDGVISDLGDKVDNLEQESLEHRAGLRPQLMDLRRKTILLRRYISPQREALSALSAIGESIVDADAKDILRETVDRVTRLVEELDAVRDRCAILGDQLIDQRAEEMNRHMMALSVVAAIFLPLGFLTGLLGVNVAGIPGADAPFAFPAFCVLLAVLGAGLYLWFRHRRWI